jgi:hypothetical protein
MSGRSGKGVRPDHRDLDYEYRVYCIEVENFTNILSRKIIREDWKFFLYCCENVPNFHNVFGLLWSSEEADYFKRKQGHLVLCGYPRSGM